MLYTNLIICRFDYVNRWYMKEGVDYPVPDDICVQILLQITMFVAFLSTCPEHMD